MHKKPNIILVNCDDLGWGDLACGGHPTHRTPNLDRMAAEGTRFTDFYQGSPVCSPSRGGMMTGCYPRRIGFDLFEGKLVLFPGQGVGLSKDEETFAQVLKRAGYATAAVGKWHCGDQQAFLPTEHGFDQYFGLPYSNDMGRQVKRESSPPLPLLRNGEVVEQQPDQASLTSRYVDESIGFMRSHAEGPFLLYLAHMHVHLPHYVPERFAKVNPNRYAAAVEYVDWAMGRLLRELDDLGIAQDTLVLFTSDNGSRNDYGGSNGHLRGSKGMTWEGGIRVPLIARQPGTVPAGRVCSEIVAGLDLLPTFAALAGTAPKGKNHIDGKDFSPLLLGKPGAKSPRDTFFYYIGGDLDAVRSGKWKLFVGRHGWAAQKEGGVKSDLRELYNLEADPGETTDVSAANPEVVKRLLALIDRCLEDLGDETKGLPGTGRRPIGKVANPKPLTEFDPGYPYFTELYDLDEIG